MEDIKRVIEQDKEAYMEDLFALLRRPSISAQDVGVRECAILLSKLMEEAGIKTAIYETPRQPIVFGQTGDGRPRRTILVYGHYDVQPPEPLDQWKSPPFEPTIRDGKIYGRGTSDNKAQLFAHVKGIQAYLKARGRLPKGLQMKYIFEGEEEIGSPNLQPFAEANRQLLAADAAIFSDSHVHESGLPTIHPRPEGHALRRACGARAQAGHAFDEGGRAAQPGMAPRDAAQYDKRRRRFRQDRGLLR